MISGGVFTKQPVTGSFELIKNLNTSCILDAIREKGMISRADIARQTGLTPATVSNITAEMMDLGLIEETERGASNGGRKPVMLSIRSSVCKFAGVHISSDTLETAIVDTDANILWHERAVLPKGVRHTQALDQAIRMIGKGQESLGADRISGIGVCVHGLVRSEEGLLVYAPNLGWENVRIGDVMESEFSVPAVVENDVHAMTLAESWCGFARSVKDYVYLYIGPGIGGSVVFNNELYKGYGGFAGEFGHNTIEPDGPLCTCGNRGCFQALASETTMLENFRKRKGAAAAGFTFADMMCEAKAGDADAREVILQAARYIGVEVGNIINALSPSLIVINGRVTGFGNMVMTVIDDEVRRRGLKYSQNFTRIVFSHLGEKAPIEGAATCIIRELFASPKKFLRLAGGM